MTERVVTKVHEGIAEVLLQRPDKHNALDPAMCDALINAAAELGARTDVRVVVMRGEGRSFCSGLDFPAFLSVPQSMPQMFAPAGEGPANRAQKVAWAWTELPVPVIAALHGHVYGGGLQVALAADIRVCTPDARLSIMEIEYGLVPDMSGTQTLRRLVRADVIKELTYTGRIVNGVEAQALGLVTHVSEDPVTAAHALATQIAARSPSAIRAAKQLLDASAFGEPAAGLHLEAEAQKSLIGKPDQLEAVAAKLSGRAPRFRPPA